MKNESYKINMPGFEGATFTMSSKYALDLPKAVQFAAGNKAVLQSAREAIAYRINAGGHDYAECHQATRTCAVYFKKGNKYFLAVDDSPDPAKNIVLARAQEGYDTIMNTHDRVLPKNDKHIAQILERAELSDRIVQVTEELLLLSVEERTGGSAFGKDKTARALLGDVAEPYARLLHKHRHPRGLIYLPDKKDLLARVDRANVVVRHVKLGSDHDWDERDIGSTHVYAHTRNVYGYARGVRNPTEWRK